jgi:hypothetical protein
MRPRRTHNIGAGDPYGRGHGVGRDRGRGRGRDCWQDVNYSSHCSKAVQGAEILVRARLRKSKLIHEPCVKDAGFAVHVIRRTKLPIFGAWRATGDTVKIALPRPAHGVADADVDGIRQQK